MIYTKNTRILNPEESFVLVDFDRTLTNYNSSTTWGVFEECSWIDPSYRVECTNLFHRYRPIEISTTVSYLEKFKAMERWGIEVVEQLQKFHISKNTIEKILSNSNGLCLRKDVGSFLGRMDSLEVPVIIISAGVGDIIKQYLEKKGLLFPNISIYSNFLLYDEEGNIIGVKEPIIHSLNKGIFQYPEIGSRKSGFLFGDQIEDIKTGGVLDTINVGFCNTDIYPLDHFQKNFDIVLTENSSFEEVAKVYMKKYKK